MRELLLQYPRVAFRKLAAEEHVNVLKPRVVHQRVAPHLSIPPRAQLLCIVGGGVHEEALRRTRGREGGGRSGCMHMPPAAVHARAVQPPRAVNTGVDCSIILGDFPSFAI